MAWIKFEKDLLTDPRVLRMARTLESRWELYEEVASAHGMGACNSIALPAVTLVCGALVRIWSLADTHLGADELLPLGMSELDEVVGIPDFCSLIPDDWLVEIDEHTVKLPNFHSHNGIEAKKKAVTQKRVARFRSKALQDGNGSALPDQTKTRPINNTSTPTGFDSFWKSWPTTPRKQGKSKCQAVWLRKNLEARSAEILAHVEAMKQTDSWRGGYEPMPMTYLNQERWDGAESGNSSAEEIL